MKMRLTKTLITTLFVGLFWGSVQADVMDMRSVGYEPPGVSKPKSGMSMDQESSKFGEPNNKMAAVGDPPITRWEYDQYTVYFEYDRVIHAVVHTK